MSVVVGIEAARGVWLAADSCYADEHEKARVADKLFPFRGIGFGIVDTSSHTQAIRHHLDVAPPSKPGKLERWAVKVLLPALKELEEDHEIDGGFTMIVAHGGQIVVVEPSWSVWSPMEGYAAIGSGSLAAYGALHATRRRSPRGRVLDAVGAAIAHVPTVDGPTHSLWVPA